MGKRLGYIAVMQFIVPMVAAQIPPVPEKAGADSGPGPRLFVAQRLHDLGTVFEGDKLTVRWLLENRGNADLIIEHTRSSCGCAVVQLAEEQRVIPPGGSLEFEAEFDSRGRRGMQSKNVTVTSNDPAEPTLKLEFTANVQLLYEMRPPGVVNLRGVRRGQAIARTIDIFPSAGRKAVEILDLQAPDDAPLSFRYEPFDTDGGTGQRIHMTVGEQVSLGRLSTKATIKLRIDGIERERVVSIRGEVVGDLTWHPRVVDATRQPSRHGKRFAPVTIRATGEVPFDVLEANAGALFDVTFAPVKSAPKSTQYSVLLTLRDDAASGPFGAMLEVRTSSLDQPVVRVPVFGIVAAPIEVEPPVILLRQDGTDVGTHRRVKLQVLPQMKLDVSEITCDSDAVTATIDWEASARYQHIRYLDVRLSGELSEGTHRTALRLTTNIEGMTRLEVPVIIDVPRQKG